METARERLRHELHHVLHNLRADVERAEMLTAALDAFSKPVPDYEPTFRHFSALGAQLNRFELRDRGASEA
jgi:hypothetical protein